jgi:hypothetical protein
MMTALMTRWNPRKITWSREKVTRSVHKTLGQWIIAVLKCTLLTFVFIAKDKTKWGKANSFTRIRRRWQNNLITDEILDNTVQNTNNYIFILPKFSCENVLKLTEKTEIQAAICLMCLAGALQSDKKSPEELWGTDGDRTEQFRLVMNERFFRFHIRCILE